MRIGVIGSGRIGGNAARLFAQSGHELLLSFSRDQDKLARQAAEIGARAGTPREAAEFGEVVMLSVPWTLVDEALDQAGPLEGESVVHTTEQFGPGGGRAVGGRTAAQVNAARMPGAAMRRRSTPSPPGSRRRPPAVPAPTASSCSCAATTRRPSASSPA